MGKVRYFTRTVSQNDFDVVMRDEDGFETVVASACKWQTAANKVAKLQAKEDHAAGKLSA